MNVTNTRAKTTEHVSTMMDPTFVTALKALKIRTVWMVNVSINIYIRQNVIFSYLNAQG